VSRNVDVPVDPIEALIALFKASEIWSDYRVAVESSDCLDSSEVVRERWIRQWPYQRLFASWEDDRSRRLSILEQKFFATFAGLGRSGQITTKHRILAKHHPTTNHYSTSPEMFENVGITVDRGEILMQLSRGPCLKIVEIKPDASTKLTGIAGEAMAARPIPKRPQKPPNEELIPIVRAYHVNCAQDEITPTLKGLQEKMDLPRNWLREAWVEAGYPLLHGGDRKSQLKRTTT
jgi:hypothetical protein